MSYKILVTIAVLVLAALFTVISLVEFSLDQYELHKQNAPCKCRRTE